MKISHDQILEMLNTGISCYQQGNLIRAEQLYRQVLAAHPKNADALHLLGLILRDRGDIDGALQLFKKALKIAPVFLVHATTWQIPIWGLIGYPKQLKTFSGW